MNSVYDEELIAQSFARSVANIEDFDSHSFAPNGLTRDGIVVIKDVMYKGTDPGFLITLNGPAFIDQKGSAPKAVIPFDRGWLHGHVQRCRSTWLETIVHLQRRKPWLLIPGPLERPYQERVSNDKPLLDAAAPALARAGAELFKVLFDDGDERLQAVGAKLRSASARTALTITCYSNRFFIPWGMLYTCPNQSPFPEGCPDPKGFWGYRHVIEHSVDRFAPVAAMPMTNGKLRLGYNYDARLLSQVRDQLTEFYSHPDLDLLPRTRLQEVAQAFQSKPYPDGLSHFYVHCHSSGSEMQPAAAPPRIEIDQQTVTAADVGAWIKGKLSPMPFFLLSACEGGQMDTMFYETFARELLVRDAQGIVGPQVEIPMVFATQYARRFVELLLSNDGPPKRVGEIVRELAQQFWDKSNNPLGLVYSLYRGADSFVERIKKPN